MPTTEEARPALVQPEFGPTGPELVRRRFGPRGRRIVYALAAVVVAALAALIASRAGDGLQQLTHKPSPQFTMLYPPETVHRVKPGPGEIVRFRSRRGGLRMLVAVRRLTLPAYEGSVSGLLPVLADRQKAALARELPGFRLRGEGKARVNDAPGYQLRYTATGLTNGYDIFVVPDDGDREGVLLRYRQANPPRALGAPGKELVKATRKTFRSFRFGLERK